ncbi:hypothetical protein N0V93_001932 [Gnomoniopsis smithogilvyi]|uniref:Uncharacterized protein n=1 Tax=Gnomoniopsis smithogilvyi TaxID=1191159 RepID=A0A9W9D250_9PEZI|nr:hypothetical protein N0V93_001932 [Gnomoniopsis smithogilvyi]
MPPPTRAPLRALALRTAPIATTTIPRTRHFHTTPCLSQNDVPIPPESPKFFSLPDLPQSDETKPPPVKGRLPVPRQIFTKRAHGAHKISPDFVNDTAPYSRAESVGEPPKSDKDAWKRLMAESRRTALGEGVTNLWRRKLARDKKAQSKSAANAKRNRDAGFAPERLDDVYTRGTVTQATLETKVVRDPDYVERQQESAARTAAIQAAKSEARKDAIQRLYVEASQFIVTEADLAARIDAVFTDDYFVKTGKSRGDMYAENWWASIGQPVTVAQKLAELKGRTRAMTEAYRPQSDKTTKRQKIVAGELTGGALSVQAEWEVREQDLSGKLGSN